MRYSVVNDEVDSNIDNLINILKNVFLNNVELRKIDNNYLFQVEEYKLKHYYELLHKNKIKVTLIDSPIGKHKFDYDEEFKLIIKYIKICKIFNCKYLRIFSDVGECIEEVLNKYNQIVKENDITLLIENEINTFGNDYKYLKKLMMNNYSNIGILFDIENYYSDFIDYKRAYVELKPYIKYIHIRDYSKDKMKYVNLFDGDIDLKYVLDNKDVIVSLETHLALNNDSNINDNEKNFINNIRRIREYDI